uniref:Mitotic spindle organizing protein 2B n=1 Tax=Neogobius melanostomus TaxID=47308 RepID=A0A8C6WJH2_9GOBI
MSQQTTNAPDSPALIVSANVQKYAIKKKKVLSAEDAELFELTQAAGVTIDQEVFKIIVDLLKMNVAPQAVFQTLKAMCAGQRVAECGTESSSAAHTTSIITAPTEARVRNKTGASYSEKSREPSTQKVQRQPSANRGQKTKSSGSSSSSSQINST